MCEKITREEILSLRNSKNEEEWNAACEAIKAARNGRYPYDWWGQVMSSGLAAHMARQWGTPNLFKDQGDDLGNWIA